MKIMTSYFYQIRNFKPNMIPLSTALFDPSYFHQGRGKNYQFWDKNGVLNGVRAEVFMPGEECEGLCHGPDGCKEKNKTVICPFLKTYYEQLKRLNFNEVMERFKKLENSILSTKSFEDEIIFVLIVYEAPNNPCSERGPLHWWFKDNGYEIEEFKK